MFVNERRKVKRKVKCSKRKVEGCLVTKEKGGFK
jgi:hypothetical protein